MYTFENLIDDVKKEAAALKVHATKEELGKISMKSFAPAYYNGCIYGMATGDCFSDRASELISACCVRYFHNESFTIIQDEGFKAVQERVSGTFVEDLKNGRKSTFPTHYSAIEAYVLLPEAKNANLIAYLKGETETLEL